MRDKHGKRQTATILNKEITEILEEQVKGTE
jgi:uncharacterized membrane-anchored protein